MRRQESENSELPRPARRGEYFPEVIIGPDDNGDGPAPDPKPSSKS